MANWVRLLDEAREPVAAKFGTESREAEREMELAAVGVSIDNLRTFPFVRDAEERGDLKLRGTFFAISEGVLYLRNEETREFEAV